MATAVIIQSQYPKLYQLWRQYPTLVQTLEAAYAQRPSSEEEILTGIRRTAERKPAAPQTGEGASPPVAGRPTSDSTGGELGECLNIGV